MLSRALTIALLAALFLSAPTIVVPTYAETIPAPAQIPPMPAPLFTPIQTPNLGADDLFPITLNPAGQPRIHPEQIIIWSKNQTMFLASAPNEIMLSPANRVSFELNIRDHLNIIPDGRMYRLVVYAWFTDKNIRTTRIHQINGFPQTGFEGTVLRLPNLRSALLRLEECDRDQPERC